MRSTVRHWSPGSPAAPAAVNKLILDDEHEMALQSIVLPQLLSLYNAARRDRSMKRFNSYSLGCEPFTTALRGWFFNDRAVKLTADGIRGGD